MASCKSPDERAVTTTPDVTQPDTSPSAPATRDSTGVFLVVDSLDLSTASLTISVVNNTDSLYSTGDYYIIEKHVGDKFITMPYKPVVFRGLGHDISPRSSRQFTIDLSDLDGTFDPGDYRITKNVICNYRYKTITTLFNVE